jgi:hypothetical protein
MEKSHLDRPDLDAVIDAALEAELATRPRELLLDGIPQAVRDNLHVDRRPADQLRLDVQHLNKIPALDGLVPFQVWLHNAVRLARPHPAAERLARFCIPADEPQPERELPLPEGDWMAQLTRGIRPAAGERLRRLLEYYCGASGERGLFAGRDGPLADLRQAALEGPRLVVVGGPAGRGKTALLCHLVKALVTEDQVSVVFHAFSERFGTAAGDFAFEVLLGRLSRLHQKSFAPGPDRADRWALLASYLRSLLPGGRRLVVVLDGIDEATDVPLTPDLLPHVLPEATCIILSVRSSGHLDGPRLIEQLAWRPSSAMHLHLPLLDQSAVEAVLAEYLPQVADPANVRRLHALCEGDPLVLGLLVEEWREHGAQLEGPTQPGIEGLWNRQVRRSEHDALAEGGPAWHLVAALASAVGPLTRDDVLSLLEGEVPNGVVLNRALEAIGRFVFQPEPGVYVFCHSRLRQHVEEKLLGPAQRAQWQQRLARWCIEHMRSARPPAYVAAGLVHHLQRVGEGLTDEWQTGWLGLLEPAWLEVRKRVGGLLGYLGDLEALRAVLEADARRQLETGGASRHATVLVRCALCVNSARRTAHLPLFLLIPALRRGLIDPHAALAGSFEDSNPLFGLLPKPWGEWVALLPAGVMPEALDRAIEMANLSEGGEEGFLRAMMARILDWFPRRGLGWLYDLGRVTLRLQLLATAHRELPEGHPLRPVLVDRCQREAESVTPRYALWSVVEDLQSILSTETILPWLREAADLSAVGPTPAHRRDTLVHIARGLPLVEQADRVRHAVLGTLGDTSTARRSLLRHIGRDLPKHLGVAVEVLRAHELLDECADWLWPDPTRPLNFIPGPGMTSDFDGQVERCAALRALLTEVELERLKARAIDQALRVAQYDIGAIRGLVPSLEPQELLAVIGRIEFPEQQWAAARSLIASLPPDSWHELLVEAVNRGSRDEVFDIIEATRLRPEVEVAARLALVEQVADPLVQSILYFDAALRGHESLAEANRALRRAVEQSSVKPGTLLRFYAMFGWLSLTPKLLEFVLETAERDVEALIYAWSQVWHLVSRLAEPWRTNAVERLVSALLSEPSHLSSLPSRVEEALPPEALLRVKRAQLDLLRANGDGQSIVLQVCFMLPLIPHEDERRSLIAEALEANARVSDHLERLEVMCRLGAGEEAIERVVEPLLRHPERVARLQAWRTLPEAWFESRPACQRAWIDDELAYIDEFRPGSGAPLCSLQALFRWGEAGEYDRWLAERRDRLTAKADAVTPPLEEMREWPAAFWNRLVNERENPASDWIRSVLLDVALVSPGFTNDEAFRWAKRLPLYQNPTICALLDRLDPSLRAPIAEELWDYFEQLEGADRGTQRASVVRLLADERRGEAVSALLAEASVHPVAHDGHTDNRIPILFACAPFFSGPHLERTLELAGGVWMRSDQNLLQFVQRLQPEFRRLFIPNFITQLKEEFPDDQRTFHLGSQHHAVTMGPDVSGPKGPRQLLLPHLVACDDGPDPAAVDWSTAASPAQIPSQPCLKRLGERLSSAQLRAYLRSWQRGAGGNWFAPVVGMLGVALLKRPDATGDDRAWLAELAGAHLFRPGDSRMGLLTTIMELSRLLDTLAGRGLGAELGALIEEVGLRWP